MPVIKMQTGNSPQNKRRMVAASGGYAAPSSTDINKGRKYGGATSVSVPITKTAQYAGSGANVIFTQPMFFSPLHTPQNWQIAAKRREVYQWSFIEPCFITQYGDFSLVSISKMVNSINKKSSLYIQDEEKGLIQDGYGYPSYPDKATKRYIKKKANKIKVMGVAEPLSVTFDHNCMVVKRKDVKCIKNGNRNNEKKNNKNCITGYNAPTCKIYKCSEYQDKNYKISKIKAKDVKKGDYFLVPFDSTIKDSLIKDEDQARFAGFLASDGTVSDKCKNVRICMHQNEMEAVFPPIKKVFSDFGIDGKLEKSKSSQVLEVRSSGKKLFKFAHSLVQGKGKDKKFTKEVMLLDPKLQLHVLGAYIQADGCFNKISKAVEITTYSMHLANQLITMFYRCGILARVNKQPISKSKGTFFTNNTHRYIINVPSSESHFLKEYVPYKITSNNFKKFRGNNRFFWGNYVLSPVSSNDSFEYEGPVYDIRVPRSFTVTANGVSVYQCRFYYCFTPENLVLMEDGVEKRIDEISEGDKVINGKGTISTVKKIHSREISENILKIKVGGLNREIATTFNHEIPRINQFEWKKHYSALANKAKSKALYNKYGDFDFPVIWEESATLEVGDRLFTPSTEVSDGYENLSIDECYLAGMFLAEGSYYWYNYKEERKYPKAIRFSIHENELATIGEKIKNIVKAEYNLDISIYEQNNEKCIDIVIFNVDLSKKMFDIIGDGCKTKKIKSEFLKKANKEQILSLLAGYIDGDGCVDSHHGCQIITASDILSSQIPFLLEKIGATFSVFKTDAKIRKCPNNKMSKEKIYSYNIRLSRHCIDKILKYSINEVDLSTHHTKYREYLFLKNRHYRAITSIKEEYYEGPVFDLELDEEHSYCVNRCVVHNSNEPKVAAGVDFYSNFSMNGFKLECKSKKVLKYYERLVEKLKLSEKLNDISHEYFLLGDVFPFSEIECPKCGGRNQTEDGELCRHPDGSFKSIKILNPDYIEIKTNPLASQPEYFLMPDEELRTLVQRREPRKVYENLPQEVIALILTGQPIPLSSRSTGHLKHNASPYGTYGSSMLQRLFTVLAYKTKIMTANWIVAERLILPVRVVKVGDKERPATEEDLQDVVNQLANVANDPNLTIVTHHAFDYEYYGATGKIHNITQEVEQIGKEILDGLMLNQAILNGEMGGYSSAQVGVEVLIRRLENWRNKLKDWVEKNIFLPVAMMQGFVDEEETNELGETVYQYPDLIFNDLQLRDKTNKIQSLMQLYDKGLVSAQTILEELGLDYDTEVEKIRSEQVVASASGMMMPGAGGMGGMGGDMGGMGGMPGGDMGGMGGMPGGDMGGGMGGMPGAMPGGDMGGMGGGMGGMPAAAESLPKITKRGKGGGKEEEQETPPNQMIKLTKLEQQMYKMLKTLNAPYPLFGQYAVKVPGEERPFTLDFAYPKIGVGCEVDGSIWHQREDFIKRDQVRDQKLANVGWRILRFKENAIEQNIDAVKDIVYKNMVEASKDLKKRAEDQTLQKYAAVPDYINRYKDDEIGMNIKELPHGLGKLILIGTVANGE